MSASRKSKKKLRAQKKKESKSKQKEQVDKKDKTTASVDEKKSEHVVIGLDEQDDDTDIKYENDNHNKNISTQLLDTNEPIILNVGGIQYQTSLSTLCSYSDSILAKMFSGKFSLKPNKDGSYFIDRNGKYFEYILDYLRDGQLVIPGDGSDSNRKYLINRLLIESNFYQLISLNYLLSSYLLQSKLLNSKQILQIQQLINNEYETQKRPNWKPLFLYKHEQKKNTVESCIGYNSLLYIIQFGYQTFGIYCKALFRSNDINYSDYFGFWFPQMKTLKYDKNGSIEFTKRSDYSIIRIRCEIDNYDSIFDVCYVPNEYSRDMKAYISTVKQDDVDSLQRRHTHFIQRAEIFYVNLQ